ncbi:MAG: pyridoxal 5'-phosphate synthase glutaminase subunit PdxT [Planctomycetes bacterium]|nr:pyridoxal 5'-phosphate synthase glutaminase subunit PdxT [Planctomycetota bacterium]
MVSGVRAGVLALQGASDPHLRALAACGVKPMEVRTQAELDAVTHLVIPGGESTTMHHLLTLFDLWNPIRERASAGTLSLFGTCAGAILLGRAPRGEESRPPRLGLLDAVVERNAFGRQVDSFVEELPLAGLDGDGGSGGPPFLCTFIRAPRIRSVGPAVEVLGSRRGEPILVRAPGLLASTFHPELTGDVRIHRLFLQVVPSPSAKPAHL